MAVVGGRPLRAAAKAACTAACWRGRRNDAMDRRCTRAVAGSTGGNSAASSVSTSGGSGDGGGDEDFSATVGGGARRKLIFPDLQPNDFRHPLDRQNTSLLRAIPGLSALTRAAIGPLTEEMMVFDNIASSVRISESQLPEMHALLIEACATLAIRDPPDLYLKQSPSVNAYTLAIDGQKPFIVLHTALVELLDEQELQAVIAHELAHIKCDHGTWLTRCVRASHTVKRHEEASDLSCADGGAFMRTRCDTLHFAPTHTFTRC